MTKFKEFIDACSLSGAIILIFSVFIVLGVMKNNEKVWSTAFTALTTFVSGKQIGKLERKIRKRKKIDGTK
jgi:hypothetical protein